MNPDDFEQQLQRQPLRTPPAAWRVELLKVAHANIRTGAATQESELRTGWRALMARISPAWGAVAGVWLIIVGANSLLSGSSGTASSGGPMAGLDNPLTVWSLQRAELSLLAENNEDAPKASIARPKNPQTPRSNLRREEGLGDWRAPFHNTTLA